MMADFAQASAGDHLIACANTLALLASVLLTRFIIANLRGAK